MDGQIRFLGRAPGRSVRLGGAKVSASAAAKTAGDLPDALTFGPDAMADFPFEKYFYWFLNRNLLEEAKESFAAHAMARLRDKVFL